MSTPRTCGACVACCVAFDVGALNKPTATPCRYLAATAAGCAVYAERPEPCVRFECDWVKDAGGGWRDDERPDRVGVVVSPTDPDSAFTRATAVPLLVVYELRRDALASRDAQRLLRRLGRKRLLGIMRFGWECGDREPSAFLGPSRLLRVVRSWAPVSVT